MQTNPSVVVGHLSDEEIKKSIESIVATVDDGAKRMAAAFDAQISEMEKSFGRLKNLKAEFVEPTSTTKKSAKTTKEESQAQRDFDANLDRQAAAIQKANERKRIENEKSWIEYERGLDRQAAKTETYYERDVQNKEAAEKRKKDSDYRAAEQEIRERQRVSAETIKEAEKADRMLVAQKQKQMKLYARQLSGEFSAAYTMPTSSVDDMVAKLDRLKRAQDKMRESGLFDEARLNRNEAAINRVTAALEKAGYVSKTSEEGNIKSARESYLAFMKGYKAQGEAIAKQIQDAEIALNKAIETRTSDLTSKLDSAKRKLNELYSTLAAEQEKAKNEGTLGMPFNAGIARTQQAIEYTKKHIDELQTKIANVPNEFRGQVEAIDQLKQKREQVLNTMKEEAVVRQREVSETTEQASAESTVAERLKEQLAIVNTIKSKKDATSTFEKISLLPQGDMDEILVKGRAIEALLAKVRDTPLMSQKDIKLADKMLGNLLGQYRQLKEAKEMASRAESQSSAALRQEEQSAEQLRRSAEERARREKEYRDSIINGSQEAINKANELRAAMEQQFKTANYTEQITGVKELSKELKILEQAYRIEEGRGNTARAEEIQKIIQLSREAIDVTTRYNMVAAGIGSFGGNAPKDTIAAYTAEVQRLSNIYKSLSKEEREAAAGRNLLNKMQELQRTVQILKKEMSRPINLASVLKLDDSTLDNIAYKLQQLSSYKAGLKLTDEKQLGEMKAVDAEMEKLKKSQDELMGKNHQLEKSNNALTRSWNYMKNRLAFYFTVGASTQFIKNLIEVRSQYEMNERALGILVDSAERGTQIFNELSQMALVSPYTLIELSSAAKQLTAYGVAARDVVDTTRRMADMAAAVGIPMERLTYALGQIKAYGYLNSRDARMFLNAGIPLVQSLAEHYSKLEGRMVSVGDVYDRIKKKAVDYNEVMLVINEMTDDGGRFFDFQAKMADTLKVQLANLTLAWNNMLNDIGESQQGVLVGGIKGLKELFLQWKNIEKSLRNIAIVFGYVKVAQLVYYLAVKNTNRELALHYILGNKFSRVLKEMAVSLRNVKNTIVGANTAMKAFVAWTLGATAVAAAIVEVGMAWHDAKANLKEFNKEMRDGAAENQKNIQNFLEQQRELRESLWKEEKKTNQKGESFTIKTATDIDSSEAKKVWEVMREQIELSSAASEKYISRLLSIENVSERLRQGFVLLEDLQAVNAALAEMGDNTIFIQQDWSSWWNLWVAPDSFAENLRDFLSAKQRIEDAYGSIEEARAKLNNARSVGDKNLRSAITDYDNDLAIFRGNLKETTDSILDFITLKGWSGNTNKINEFFAQFTDKQAVKLGFNPEEAFTVQMEIEEARSKAAKESLIIRLRDEQQALKVAHDEEAKEAIQSNINQLQIELRDFEKNNGRGRVIWDNYTKWMKEQHMSEMTQMFRDMDAEQIESINFNEGKWKQFAERTAQQYAKEHKLSYNDAFTLLQEWVKNANKWSIFIPLTISTEDSKSIKDQLDEYDKQIDEADATIERLTTRKKELEKITNKNKKQNEEYTKTLEELAAAEKQKAEAEAKGGHGKKEKKDERNDEKNRKSAETELMKTLKEELSLIDNIRNNYKKLTKEGESHISAIERAVSDYDETVNGINKVLRKYGVTEFDPSAYAGIEDPNKLVQMLQQQLTTLIDSGLVKASEVKDLQVKIQSLQIDARTYNLKKITDGLNNELSKIKEEYELAVELDADPELGSMFENMFGINTDDLPHTFAEAYKRANDYAKSYLGKLKVDFDDFDLLSTKIIPDEKGLWKGLDIDSQKDLVNFQKTWREMLKKNMTETEKMLDDYVKKYGDYSDKIAEIEADRLEKIQRLNDAYFTEEMRQSQEYAAKLDAINAGAAKDKGAAKLDDFKNSQLYVAMFENLQHVSTATLQAIRKRLNDLKSELGSLSPEQLKQVTQQFEKIEKELLRRNPFKGLLKNAKDYTKALGKQGKEAQKRFVEAQREYDAQKEVVAAIKEKLKQAQAQGEPNQQNIDYLKEELNVNDEILQKLKEELEIARKLNEQYDLMRKAFGEQAQAISKTMQVIASNLSGLTELRDTLESFGINLGDDLDAIIDDLGTVGNGLSQIVSSAQSGNVVGVVSGVVKTIGGIGDSIASVFGDGAARTKRLNREISRSQETVRQLQLAYQKLEKTIEKSTGTQEIEAKRQQITNKEAEMAELQRQMELEKSKRSKDRSNDAIKQYEEQIASLSLEIQDLKDGVVSELLGSEIKSAAQSFVDAWVEAWRAGETTLDAIKEKMDEMIMELIKNAASAAIVDKLLKPLYEKVDDVTSENSEGGVEITVNEMKALAVLANKLGVDINDALGAFYGNLEQLGVVSKELSSSKELSALQQGIQGITEDTAGALEAYMNGVSQQVYLHSDLLVQIRDAVVAIDSDAQIGTQAQMLLQLQQSYAVQLAIQGILQGWSNPSGLAVRVEMV